jgi:hypothetical protein
MMARVNLGDGVNNLSGAGGIYTLKLYVKPLGAAAYTLLAPDSSLKVDASQVTAMMVSRPFAIEPGDQLSVRVIGLSGDTNVNTNSYLYDITPISTSDIFGSGLTTVNQDYGGVGNLSVMHYVNGILIGIVGATVLIYLLSDFQAGKTQTQYVQARTVTIANGAWAQNLLLPSGQYVVVAFAPGFNTGETPITV